jgi:serine/threonine protein kinase
MGPSVYHVIKKRGGHALHRGEALSVLRQLLEGLRVTHDAGLVHGDVKPENLLSSRRHGLRHCVLIDVGSAVFDHEKKAEVGTVHYMSPELHVGLPHSWPTDLFSAGLVLLEMATGRTVLGTSDSGECLAILEALLGPAPPWVASAARRLGVRLGHAPPHDLHPPPLPALLHHWGPDVVDLAARLLAWDPPHRITPHAALAHPALRGVPGSEVAASVAASAAGSTHGGGSVQGGGASTGGSVYGGTGAGTAGGSTAATNQHATNQHAHSGHHSHLHHNHHHPYHNPHHPHHGVRSSLGAGANAATSSGAATPPIAPPSVVGGGVSDTPASSAQGQKPLEPLPTKNINSNGNNVDNNTNNANIINNNASNSNSNNNNNNIINSNTANSNGQPQRPAQTMPVNGASEYSATRGRAESWDDPGVGLKSSHSSSKLLDLAAGGSHTQTRHHPEHVHAHGGKHDHLARPYPDPRAGTHHSAGAADGASSIAPSSAALAAATASAPGLLAFPSGVRGSGSGAPSPRYTAADMDAAADAGSYGSRDRDSLGNPQLRRRAFQRDRAFSGPGRGLRGDAEHDDNDADTRAARERTLSAGVKSAPLIRVDLESGGIISSGAGSKSEMLFLFFV